MFDWVLNTHLGNFFKNPTKKTFIYKFCEEKRFNFRCFFIVNYFGVIHKVRTLGRGRGGPAKSAQGRMREVAERFFKHLNFKHLNI